MGRRSSPELEVNPNWISISPEVGVLETGLACVTVAGSVAVGDALERGLRFFTGVVSVTGGMSERGFAFNTWFGSVIGTAPSLAAVIGKAPSLVAVTRSLSSEVRRSSEEGVVNG